MKPILKWAGGKSSLIQDIKMFLPKDIEKRKYHEPFFGGGALFFDLEPKKGTINDVNEKLINFYKIVKEQPESLILEASAYQKYATDVEKYYELREEFNDSNLSDLKSAALFLYFNKTAYNGLYRVNSQNKFNVPIGKYKKPNIVNKKRIREASKILKNIEILCEDFIYIEKKSSEGDFCYFDPPYYQSSPNKFTDYSKKGFTLQDHKKLRDLCVSLNEKGVYFVLSNSNTPEIKDMYLEKNFDIKIIDSKWMISCNALSRGQIKEILVHNLNYF